MTVALCAGCGGSRAGSARDGGSVDGSVDGDRPVAGSQAFDEPHGPIPDPATTTEVTLDAILAFADAKAPSLAVARAARARVEAARAHASALLPQNPEVGFGVGPRIVGSDVGVDVAVSLSQQIEIAGERGLRLDAADSFADLTEAQIVEARWNIHADVHAAFVRAQLDRERSKLAERAQAFQEELLAIVQKQAGAGEIPPLALRLAEAEMAQARQFALGAEQAFVTSRIRLGALSGWPVATPPMPVGAIPEPVEPAPLEELARRSQRSHPWLHSREAALREAEAREELSGREVAPKPTLGASYERESAPAGGDDNHIVLGTLTMPIPIWQTNQGAQAAAAADKAIAEAELGAVRLVLGGRLAEKRAEVALAVQRVRSFGTEVLPRLDENLKLLKRSYELGEIDLIALSAGKERFLRIQAEALVIRNEYFQALTELERVVGSELGQAPGARVDR